LAVAILFFIASPSRALNLLDLGLAAAGRANGLLITNPPLPMLYMGSNTNKFTIQPYTFSGDVDLNRGEADGVFSGDFEGKAAGIAASFGFSRRWGFYTMALASFLDGNFAKDPGPKENLLQRGEIIGAEATYAFASMGLMFRYFNKNDEGFTLSTFLGPAALQVKLEERIKLTFKSGGVYDYEIEADEILPGGMFGIQAGINLGRYFRLNPFAVAAAFPAGVISYTETGIVHEDTRTGQDSTFGFSSSGDINSATEIEAQQISAGGGINLLFKPLGLSLNITAPFAKHWYQGGGIFPTMATLSWSFGNYSK